MEQAKKILFAGDPHGNFQPLLAAVHAHNPQAVVLLGDYDLDEPLEKPLAAIKDKTDIWWIAGNHDFETPDKHRNLFQSALADKGLHLRVAEVAGIRIAGLGGIFLGRVWYPPKPPKWLNKQHYLDSLRPHLKRGDMPLKYQCAIWHDEFHALAQLQADILVTHEAPGSHKHGFHAISELASAMGVRQVYHGHLHENYTKTIKHNIQVFGVANAAVADLVGGVVCQRGAVNEMT